MNVTHIIGNLTRDVEIRYSQAGSPIANTGIAANKKWRDQSGQSHEKVMFIDITFFGRQAEIANQYLRKGSKIGITAELDFQQWTAQDNSKRSKHALNVRELDMLDTKEAAEYKAKQDQYADRAAGKGNQYSAPAQQGGYSAPAQQGGYSAPIQQGGYATPAQQGGYSDPQGQRR